MVYDFDIELAWSDLLFYLTYFCYFLWSAQKFTYKIYTVILYSMIISWHICIFSYSFSWFSLKHAASHRTCYWLRDCEWMRCNAIIYHCMSWVICFSRLFIHDLFTNNDPVSIRPPPNQMKFCCFYSQLEHLSLFLWHFFFLCLTWTTCPFFPRHTAWIVWEDAGREKESLRLQRQRNIWLC